MRSNPWIAGLVTGIVVAVGITLFVCVWEWLENPGGIFRGADGTRWRFVRDTAVSWFVPTFCWVAAGTAVLHWMVGRVIRRLRSAGAGR